MTIAEKMVAHAQNEKTIAENQQKVYDAGFAAGSSIDYDTVFAEGKEQGEKDAYDAFWDTYQDNGNRTHYSYAFAGRGWQDEVFKPKYPLTNITAADSMFSNNMYLDYMDYDLDLSNCSSNTYLFNSATSLKRVKSIKFNNSGKNTYVFASCGALRDVTIKGTIAFDISFSASKDLTLESLTSIINAYEAGAYTLTLHANAKARLTDELKQIAADKGLTIK
ncbi:MAG: hypothetical protein IJN04_02620 [Clostridia bacterium]|nr:hypothetical protein [Clostridia bacterium]